MACFQGAALLSLVFASPVEVLAEAEVACKSDTCGAAALSAQGRFRKAAVGESFLLQTHQRHTERGMAGRANTTSTYHGSSHCEVGDSVRCPGSSGVWCSGQECCPGENGEENFPCPSAPSGWGQDACQSTSKRYDCTERWQCRENDLVQCPGSGVWCHGEMCCPGVGDEPNFPCPSAPSGWGEGSCQSPAKQFDCTLRGNCPVGDVAECPGDTGAWCAGEQCCPGVDGEKNFPCPSAPNSWGQNACESTTKAYDCTTGFQCHVGEAVQCPGSGVWCSGESCCPGGEGEQNFPCPSAPGGWGLGMCESAEKRWDCTLLPQLQNVETQTVATVE